MLLTDDCAINLTYDPDCLYVRVEDSSYCIAPWRADMACSRYENRHWRPVPDPPDWRFGEYRPRTELYSPVARYLAPIPPELRRLAGRFAWMQVPALRLLRLTPYAAQLAANEPFLFWLMAVAFQKQRFTAGECLALFRLPRRKILGAVMDEDPGGKYLSVDTLHKLRPQRYDSGEYIMFMALYQNGLFKTARHVPSICLQTLRDMSTVVDLSIIAGLLGETPFHLWPEACCQYRECRRLALNHKTPRLTMKKLMACRSLRDLRYLHGELIKTLSLPNEKPPFPPPPLAGSDTIVPITTPLELHEEGVVMEHCVYSWAENVYKGWVYIYRVLAPERGTLSVSIIDGRRRIDEFSLYRNAKPSAASLAHVRAWLTGAVADKTRPKGNTLDTSDVDGMMMDEECDYLQETYSETES